VKMDSKVIIGRLWIPVLPISEKSVLYIRI
jgi:hypothetical protein